MARGWPKGKPDTRQHPRGEQHPRWKGGASPNHLGYIRVTAGADRDKYQHRATIERLHREGPCRLRRLLLQVEIHHIDFDRAHNCPLNLLVLDEALHNALSAAHATYVRRMRRERRIFARPRYGRLPWKENRRDGGSADAVNG